MRLRPIGPGIGGLYYSPLLQQDARIFEPPVVRSLPVADAPAARSGPLNSAWRSFAAGAERFGQRLIAVRLAQAEAQITRARAIYDADGQFRRGREIDSRYY